MKKLNILLFATLLTARADGSLLTNLLAYYDFEEAGTPGLANKVPGAIDFDGSRFGSPTWNTSANPSGPGFAGNAAFNGGDGLSDRSTLLAGNALNLVDARGDAMVVPLDSTQLGGDFTISVWHSLTPGASNNSDRYFVFEAQNNFDVSWGTPSQTTTTGPRSSYNYKAYVAGSSTVNMETTLLTGTWNHTAHVFSSSSGVTTLELYVNGQFVSSHTATAPEADMDFTSIYIGRHRSGVGGDRDWDGLLDEVAIWNRALTVSEINDVFILGATGQPLSSVIPEPGSFSLLLVGILLTRMIQRGRVC